MHERSSGKRHTIRTKHAVEAYLNLLTVESFLRGQQPLYAVLDAARHDHVLAWILASGLEQASLYEGEEGQRLAPWGPYLVRMEADSPGLRTLLEQGWGQAWGIFLCCSLPFAEVRRQLRRFLTVRLPEGRSAYFRFYDPRVLRDFLPGFSTEQVREFLGPIQSVFLEGTSPEECWWFHWNGQALVSRMMTPSM